MKIKLVQLQKKRPKTEFFLHGIIRNISSNPKLYDTCIMIYHSQFYKVFLKIKNIYTAYLLGKSAREKYF